MVSNLSGPTLEKATKELNEIPDKRMEVISEMREKLEEWRPDVEDPLEQNLTLSRVDDDKFLLCFLRARKFDVNRATQLFVNYYKFRAKHQHILGDITATAAEPVLKKNIISLLPQRSKEGCKVLVARIGLVDFDEAKIEDVIKMLVVILDKLIEDEETQVHGIMVCEDLQELTLGKMMALMRKEFVAKGMMLELLQDGFPARFKGFHIVNQPWYISIFMTLLRPFMKQKTKDRMHMHGYDYESLHQFLPPDQLPKEFGGELDSLDTYSAYHLFSDELDTPTSN